MIRKKPVAPVTVGTLESVQPGDSAILESGATVELGFFLGGTAFVRFSDNNEPRAISGLPASTAVVSVMPRARSISAAPGPVRDPLDQGEK